MTSGQRKAHRYIWLLLILLVPLLIIFSTKDLNLTHLDTTTSAKPKISKDTLIKVVENELIKASLYSNSIEIILKSTLKNASSIVYETDSKGNKIRIIGQLNTSGIYNFKLETQPKSILVYDGLKESVITKLEF